MTKPMTATRRAIFLAFLNLESKTGRIGFTIGEIYKETATVNYKTLGNHLSSTMAAAKDHKGLGRREVERVGSRHNFIYSLTSLGRENALKIKEDLK